MSERFFRTILGTALLVFLFMEWDRALYGFICLMLFEGITNWRIPVLISRLRYGSAYSLLSEQDRRLSTIDFEAERALRLASAGFLIIAFVLFHDVLWFLPWLQGFALIIASFTSVCPLTEFFRKLGFK